jgi:ABC-type transport system involved in cytochrome bd biosynthesis fused ATPase/permease subunit
VVENGVIIASGTFYELAAKSNIFNTILTQEKEKSA